MEIISKDLTHGQARSIEGALVRKRLLERINDYDLKEDAIKEQLEKSGLCNLNRGRTEDGWTSKNPLSDYDDKILDKTKKVSCNK